MGSQDSELTSARRIFGLFCRLAAHVREPRRWVAYGVAVIATAVATVVRWWLGTIVGQNFQPYIIYYPMVMLTALLGGIGPGVLATILAGVAIDYLFLPPAGLAIEDPADLLALVLFCCLNVCVSVVCGVLRRSRRRAVAEAHRAEAEARRAEASEERLRLAVETAELGTYERDLLTNKVTLNPTSQAIFGAISEPFSSDLARRSLHPEDRERVLAEVSRAYDPAIRQISISEFRILRPDGSVRWVAGRGRILFDNDASPPRPLRYIGVLNDITERQEALHALQAAKDDLARANAHLDNLVRERTAKLEETVADLEHFSYTITHDMRAPLRAIIGVAQILTATQAGSLTEEGRNLLRRICDSAFRMDRLITDALQYSSAVRQEPPLQSTEPTTILCSIVESYPQFQPPHAEVTIEPDMPHVLANEAGFTQVFSNLLGNAVKFVEPGHIPHVVVSAEPRGDFVRMWVKDDGIGIPAEYRDKVWQMFQRLSKQYEGTGVGLALVRKVVERMGGRAGVESGQPQGSQFWVELRTAA